MIRLRERFDSDLASDDFRRVTTFRTVTNPHGLHCSLCGGLFYVDRETFEKFRTAVEHGLSESPFCCEDCEQALGEEEREG